MQNKKLEQLQQLLKSKKSKSYYASRLGLTVSEVETLLTQIKSKDTTTVDTSKKYNTEKKELVVNSFWTREPSPEEIIERHNVDINKWKLHSFWSKSHSNGFSVSVCFKEKSFTKDELLVELNKQIKNYKPSSPVYKVPNKQKTKSALILNKQDAHLNKMSIDGNNNISKRYSEVEQCIENILAKSSIGTDLEKVYYILGSDLFNSEWTGMTTKGTPQQNIGSYHNSFKSIADHEIEVINSLLLYSDQVEVIYVPGNHDEFVGWHLVTLLEAHFRNQKNLKFNTSPDYTKYIKYSNTAICFNHGDVMKPEKIAQNFPIEFKKEWSNCDHYIVMVGDKHHQHIKSIGSIQFYQLPALSKAISSWDQKNGYTTGLAEMTGFLIREEKGLTDIYKEQV